MVNKCDVALKIGTDEVQA